VYCPVHTNAFVVSIRISIANLIGGGGNRHLPCETNTLALPLEVVVLLLTFSLYLLLAVDIIVKLYDVKQVNPVRLCFQKKKEF